MENLTHDQKVEYLRIALSFAGVSVNNHTSDIVVRSYEKILEKGGKVNISDMVEIEEKVKKMGWS